MTFEMTWSVTVLVDAWPNNALLLILLGSVLVRRRLSHWEIIKPYIRTSTIHDASPIAFRFADSLERTVLTKEMDPGKRWRASFYKKHDARAEMLFCKSKPIAFLPFAFPPPSSLLKLPKDYTHYHTYRVHNIGYTPWPMFHWSLVLTQFHILMKQKNMLCNENNHIYLVWLCQSYRVLCNGAN